MPAPSEANNAATPLFDKSIFAQAKHLCGVKIEAKQVGKYIELLKGYPPLT